MDLPISTDLGPDVRYAGITPGKDWVLRLWKQLSSVLTPPPNTDNGGPAAYLKPQTTPTHPMGDVVGGI